jgi:hypothetical protein
MPLKTDINFFLTNFLLTKETMKHFTIFFFIISLISCKTMNYNFVNSAGEEQKAVFMEKTGNSSIKKKASIEGIYSQKQISYKFKFDYDVDAKTFHLIFSKVLDEQMIFEAKKENDVKNYDFFVSNFFTVKIGNLLDQMEYIFEVNPENFKLYVTKDDYLVSVDENKNYQKYDADYNIIKKENNRITVRYYYKENNTDLSRIEYSDNISHFYLIFD